MISEITYYQFKVLRMTLKIFLDYKNAGLLMGITAADKIQLEIFHLVLPNTPLRQRIEN